MRGDHVLDTVVGTRKARAEKHKSSDRCGERKIGNRDVEVLAARVGHGRVLVAVDANALAMTVRAGVGKHDRCTEPLASTPDHRFSGGDDF